MRDTVFGLLLTSPQRCSSLLPTSPPGTPESAYHSKEHYQYQSKNSGWAGPTRCFQISCFCSPSAVNSQVWSKNSGWGVNFEKLLNMILTIQVLHVFTCLLSFVFNFKIRYLRSVVNHKPDILQFCNTQILYFCNKKIVAEL